jgi:hypothetical protein
VISSRRRSVPAGADTGTLRAGQTPARVTDTLASEELLLLDSGRLLERPRRTVEEA